MQRVFPLCRYALLALLVSHSLLALMQPARAAEQFRQTCNPGAYVVGFVARTGDWVDRLHILCSTWTGSALATPQGVPQWIGDSDGGSPNDVLCPGGAVVVAAKPEYTRDTGRENGWGFLDQLDLECATVVSGGVGGSPTYHRRLLSGGEHSTCATCQWTTEPSWNRCAQGEFAVGIQGEAGLFIDRIGLVCAAAPLIDSRPTLAAMGRGKPREYGSPDLGATITAESSAGAAANVVADDVGSATAGDGLGRNRTANAGLPGMATDIGATSPSDAIAPSSVAAITPSLPPTHFAPPTFEDGSRLWACEGANDEVCDGKVPAHAWCAMHGFAALADSGAPASFERGDTAVKTPSGETCENESCQVIDDLSCTQ